MLKINPLVKEADYKIYLQNMCKIVYQIVKPGDTKKDLLYKLLIDEL